MVGSMHYMHPLYSRFMSILLNPLAATPCAGMGALHLRKEINV